MLTNTATYDNVSRGRVFDETDWFLNFASWFFEVKTEKLVGHIKVSFNKLLVQVTKFKLLI
jgi:hypothetical protein